MIGVLAALTALALLATPAVACQPLAPLLAQAREHGIEYEHITDGIAVLKIHAVLRANTEQPFPFPTSLVFLFDGAVAHIGIVVNDELCGRLIAPAAAMRSLLQAVRGRNV